MLTQLATVKARLALLETDIQFDTLLVGAIQAVSERFDRVCNRTLARTEQFRQEFGGETIEICAACYPIESVSGFELKTSEAEGWVQQPERRYIIRQGCVVALERPLGTPLQQGRMTYTGGYVLPGVTPDPGQSALPQILERAAVEQVAYWFQNRDRIGLSRIWEYHGTYRDVADLDLLTSVRAILCQFTRWEM